MSSEKIVSNPDMNYKKDNGKLQNGTLQNCEVLQNGTWYKRVH
jgi:hypothetical protein